MNQQKGFTLIELMAVVAIIGILATISLPVFNHYIEKSKAAEGIHEGTSDINWVEDVYVQDGVVVAQLTASNHFDNIEHVTIELAPSADPADAAMNWDIYCDDYDAVAGTHLIDTCKGPLQGPGSNEGYAL
jgi:prepilin-type N-terminal cleavage/methylation domain-containing protein